MPAKAAAYGLIGFPLGHSFSKDYFSRKFGREHLEHCTYQNYEIRDVAELGAIVRNHPDLKGLNVTIPHKQSVISVLDELDPVASQIGAVNTILIGRKAGKIRLKGFNTDAPGFEKSLETLGLDDSVKALVFGSGGSSLAVRYVLGNLRIPFLLVSRETGPDRMDYQSVTERIAGEHRLWINCTPVGMFPATGGLLPLPYRAISRTHFLVDLIYNPEVTSFLRMGSLAGAKVINGKRMLVEQAEAAWAIWNQGPVKKSSGQTGRPD